MKGMVAISVATLLFMVSALFWSHNVLEEYRDRCPGVLVKTANTGYICIEAKVLPFEPVQPRR